MVSSGRTLLDSDDITKYKSWWKPGTLVKQQGSNDYDISVRGTVCKKGPTYIGTERTLNQFTILSYFTFPANNAVI